jgi:hypothetical protein
MSTTLISAIVSTSQVLDAVIPRYSQFRLVYATPATLIPMTHPLVQRFSNCGARPPGECCWSSGGKRVMCMRDKFILNEIWAQHKTYI